MLQKSAQEQPWNQVYPRLDNDKSPQGECLPPFSSALGVGNGRTQLHSTATDWSALVCGCGGCLEECLRRPRTTRSFYGTLPGMGWLLPHHKMPPEESRPLGTRPL